MQAKRPTPNSNPIYNHKTKNLNQKNGLGFPWRKGWDSNPCAEKSATAFRVRLVMTTSIPFQTKLLNDN